MSKFNLIEELGSQATPYVKSVRELSKHSARSRQNTLDEMIEMLDFILEENPDMPDAHIEDYNNLRLALLAYSDREYRLAHRITMNKVVNLYG